MKLVKVFMIILILSLNQTASTYELSRRHSNKNQIKHTRSSRNNRNGPDQNISQKEKDEMVEWENKIDIFSKMNEYAHQPEGSSGKAINTREDEHFIGCNAYQMCKATHRDEVFVSLYLYYRYGQLPSNQKILNAFQSYILKDSDINVKRYSWKSLFSLLQSVIGSPSSWLEKKVRRAVQQAAFERFADRTTKLQMARGQLGGYKKIAAKPIEKADVAGKILDSIGALESPIENFGEVSGAAEGFGADGLIGPGANVFFGVAEAAKIYYSEQLSKELIQHFLEEYGNPRKINFGSPKCEGSHANPCNEYGITDQTKPVSLYAERENFKVVDVYGLVTKKNPNVHLVCKSTPKDSFATILNTADVHFDREYLDLREPMARHQKTKNQLLYSEDEQEFVCQFKENNPSKFISSKIRPEVVDGKFEMERYEKQGYKCIGRNERKITVSNSEVRYDLTIGSSGNNKYFCVYYTSDQNDKGISDVAIYPSIKKAKQCGGKTEGTFRVLNYECSCVDINNWVPSTYSMYLCYKSG